MWLMILPGELLKSVGVCFVKCGVCVKYICNFNTPELCLWQGDPVLTGY